ncbi:hypothetical protein ACJDU8_20795 [Clostridium sp. WILCCON 0269]|uniref:ATP-grasp domain-containing protein n=1 Tax=Candidatus Clostridium eludens TaxID=3381663 RepID=A0ABW8SPJ8_9CLOT
MSRILKNKLKILFPEGSSLSSRQALTALGREGYTIDICDPNPVCICRFSKYVNKIYKCPIIGQDPIGYYSFILNLISKKKYDVLLPIHEQAFLFSKKHKAISKYVNIAISDFDSFELMQSKTEFMKLLKKLNIPYPNSLFIKTREELRALTQYPYYLKLAYGTAGHGTWRVENNSEMDIVIKELDNSGYLLDDSEILVQKAVDGNLCVVQSVFNNGELIGAHCYQLCAEGVGGSASARIGVNHLDVIKDLKVLGKYLNWHGCLMLDYIYDKKTRTPYYIEANPRTGETMNATLSGFNLVEILTKLSLGQSFYEYKKSSFGVKTHSLMATLLGIASRNGNRRKLISEIIKAILKVDNYRNSYEDLTNIKDDFLSVIPLFVIILKLLINPHSATVVSGNTINNYSISENIVKKIKEM